MTRAATDLALWSFALIIAVLGVLYVDAETQVALALYVPAALAAVIAFVPANGLFKSVATLVIALAIAHGVFNSHEYAFVTYIDADQTRPSDSMTIAQAVGADDVEEVAAVLIGLICASYAVALIWVLNWLQRHAR
jgi:hypothetical protein